ncbi:ribosomal protein S18-alanine N-acetyltransferase [Paraglaciecola aquimarina]|uniref:[Ribosomal protein bS18]-alanine N-acetyltransferase n=1 Tax=Paraglaciecola aquimarina TaxID=1235557 RepID=A0ABU3SZX6_9ALTE|nr:ribosomal protein S18-alanine N-acetyltransferase [Paraglaciecola aquimarina]MDU0355571.1 ribosomal protein S18-alanine N-acetyltransferase [Paraglaciecola aquimarina]
MSLHFTPLTEENSQLGFQIHSNSQFKPWSRNVYDDCLTPPYFAYYLEFEDQFLGYFIGMKVVDEATLIDIAVDKKNRGQGAGRKLLEHFIESCRRDNIQKVWLEVRESNFAAIRLYESVGFNIVETRRDYYPAKVGTEDAYIMCLELRFYQP